MRPIQLMIADDHRLFREGLKALLSVTEDIEIIGEAGDGGTILEGCQALRPDVILMDINMPGLNGIQATQRIVEKFPQVGIIMLTMLEDDASVFAAMRAGARGYLLKGADPNEVLSVIRAVAEGQALFGPAIAARMMRFFQEMSAVPTIATDAGGSKDRKRSAQEEVLSELSVRERDVLELIAAGYNNREIAQKLVISANTVRNHITSIFSKLQVADRAQAIRRARSSGMGNV
jgi:DNA-binding NarL/FixJ family response regulator